VHRALGLALAVLAAAPATAQQSRTERAPKDTVDSRAAQDSAFRLEMAAVPLAQSGKYAEALTLWQDAARIAPGAWDAHYNSGMMFELTGHADEGLKEFQTAYAIWPSPALLFHLGVSFHNIGQRDSALTWFVAATDHDPHDVMSWGYAGFTAAEMGRDSVALTYWRRALALQPRYFEMAEPEQRPLYERCLREAGAATRSP
jgi:tetratricopeptide (TPR) repeat protein